MYQVNAEIIKGSDLTTMEYKVVSSAEYTYPDARGYLSGSDKIDIFAARGSYACAQVLFFDAVDPSASLSCDLPGAEFYSLLAVNVEANVFLNPKDYLPHMPERIAPFMVFDCLRPFDGKLDICGGTCGLYIAVKIDDDAVPGIMRGSLEVALGGEKLTIPMSVEVFAAKIPDESLIIINGYNQGKTAEYHHAPMGTEEFRSIDLKYLKMLRRSRQNMLYAHGVKAESLGENRWAFDFSKLEHFMEYTMRLGYKYYNGPSVGWRKSWKEPTIFVNGNIPSMSYEGFCYLSQYLPALFDMLAKHGWLNVFMMGVADEPNDANCTEFRALCGLIHRFVPQIKLIDAMSYGNLHGALDICVPLNAEFDRHQCEFETLRKTGCELWHYVCCGPRGGGYINRFMDYPLLSTKYLFWGNYKYDLTGYLHWAANVWQPGQDPFKQNCPNHTNTDSHTILPAGDTHIMYPGKGEPWMSIRLEAQRESAEEYELLKKLALSDKKLADDICGSVFESFKQVCYDPRSYIAAKRRLLEALS